MIYEVAVKNKELLSHKENIVKFSHRSYQKGLCEGTSGNISIRYKEGFLVTASGKNLGEITLNDVLYVSSRKELLTESIQKPTSELAMHLALYEKRPDINAIVHAHPPFCIAFALSGVSLNPPALAEAMMNLGKIPLVEYELPSTQKLADKIAAEANNTYALLMANHGAVTLGQNLREAYYKMETLESYAHSMFLAKQLGNVNYLCEEDLKCIENLKNTAYAG